MKKSPTLRRNPVAVQANRKKPVVMKHRLAPKGGANTTVVADLVVEWCPECRTLEVGACQCELDSAAGDD